MEETKNFASKSSYSFQAPQNLPMPHYALSEGNMLDGRDSIETDVVDHKSGSSIKTLTPQNESSVLAHDPEAYYGGHTVNREEEEKEFLDAKDPQAVHFQELRPSFFPDEDVFVIYELGHDVQPSPRDVVALVRAGDADSAKGGRQDPDNVWSETAPQTSTNRDFPNLRSILVSLRSLDIVASDDTCYHLVYVAAKTKKILGASNEFFISRESCLDVSVKDITSILEVLVDVGDIPGLDAGSETLKHLKSFMEPVENRSEPECVVSFKRRVRTQVEEKCRLIPDGQEADESQDEASEASLWDRDGSMEELLNTLEKGHLQILSSLSNYNSLTSVPSNTSFHSTRETPCTACEGYRERLEELKKHQETSQKQIEEIQEKLKEGKELLAQKAASGCSLTLKESNTRMRKLEEKLRNIRLVKRRLEDELVEAIGRAARSKEEVMDVRQMMYENTGKMDANNRAIVDMKAELEAKDKELKDLHEYVENIHYTLSTKGYKEIKSDNEDWKSLETSTAAPSAYRMVNKKIFTVTDDGVICSSEGKLVEFEGWNVSESKKKGALRAKLTNQSGVIDHLHSTLGRLEKERQDALRRAETAEKSLESQSLEISKLKEAVAKMKQEASKAASRVESLSKIIVSERQTLQTRMEKVREALKKVDSARKLKTETHQLKISMGSDKAVPAAAEKRAAGQEPLPAEQDGVRRRFVSPPNDAAKMAPNIVQQMTSGGVAQFTPGAAPGIVKMVQNGFMQIQQNGAAGVCKMAANGLAEKSAKGITKASLNGKALWAECEGPVTRL